MDSKWFLAFLLSCSVVYGQQDLWSEGSGSDAACFSFYSVGKIICDSIPLCYWDYGAGKCFKRGALVDYDAETSGDTSAADLVPRALSPWVYGNKVWQYQRKLEEQEWAQLRQLWQTYQEEIKNYWKNKFD